MATLDTEKKDTEINNYLDKDKYYWLGLMKNSEGIFVWMEVSRAKKLSYSRWWQHKMEPDGSGICVIKDSWQQDNPKQFGWADSGCEIKSYLGKGIHALCEIPSPVNLVKSPSACSHLPGTTCYLHSEDEKMNWRMAVEVSEL